MSSLQERKKESFKIFDEIAKTYDLLNHILSFGIDIIWRKTLRKMIIKSSDINALDMATGTGDLAIELSKDPRITSLKGIDLSSEMIAIGNNKIKKAALDSKASLHIGNGVTIDTEANESYDLVTISFGIRNFNDPLESMKNIYRVLKPAGQVLIMEFSIPENIFFRGVYFFYFRYLLPFMGNIVSGHKDAYTYLNKTVEDFPYGKEFEDMLKTSGFKNVHSKKLTFGIATIYSGEKQID